MGNWEGRFCSDCGAILPDKAQSRYRIAGNEVCGKCWSKPRIAPTLQTFPYEKRELGKLG